MPDDQRTIDGVEDDALDDIGGGGIDDAGLDDDLGGDVGDVEVGDNPAAKYDDLVEGGPGSADGTADATATDDGGFLSGLFGDDETEPTATESQDSGGLSDRIGISGKGILAAFLGSVALIGIATLVPLVGLLIGVPVGLFAAGFLGGLVTDTRRYGEFSLSGAVLGVVAYLFGEVLPDTILDLTEFPDAAIVSVVGLVVGLVAVLLGHYFGRDLRAGVTQDIGS